jgi:hypothetical protein
MIEFTEAETLIDLLEKTQRKAIINGKLMPQVKSCVLYCEGGRASTTMIVRDGKTSVATFTTACANDSKEHLVIPDIEIALGVLKMFPRKKAVKLTESNGKLTFRATGKQSTITADNRALAFPHTQKTVMEWSTESQERMSCMGHSGGYTMRNLEVRAPSFAFTTMGYRIVDALKMSSMNGQKTARFTLLHDGEGVSIEVGNDLKGRSKSSISCERYAHAEGEWVFEGGLENVLEDGELDLQVIDFTAEGQGHIMLIRTPYQKIMLRSVFTV